jgi:signal transduction histidine kinase
MLLRDISQEKALEEQKNRFVANASHELRTPLTNIKTRVYLIRKQPELFEKHLSIIDNSIDRMSGLIEDLLDLSRFERGIIPLHRVQTHLQHLIEDVIYTQEAEALSKNIRLASTLPDMPIWVSVDTKRITQVITNLLINAINYTGENGNILIKVEATEQEVTLSIQDNGIGIAPEQIPHIFEPFFRATTGKATGTGLGLAIAKEIIELHEGSIWVESTLNEGSIFKIKLNRLVSPNT